MASSMMLCRSGGRLRHCAPGRMLLVIVGTVATMLATVGIGNASASTVTAASSNSQTHCVIVVDKPTGPDGISPDVYHYCSKSRTDPGLNIVGRRVRTPTGTKIISISVEIMIWYQNASYGGNSTNIYGDNGPCDSAGYRIHPSYYWETNLSSIQGGHSCTHVTLTNIGGTYAQGFQLPAHYFGSRLDNDVETIQVVAYP